MMKASSLLFSLLVSASAFGADLTIETAKIKPAKNAIDITVSYSGGCVEHNFILQQIGSCAERRPVVCTYLLVDTVEGIGCEDGVTETLRFTLEELGLNQGYYSRAQVNIVSSEDGSSVTVTLPRITERN